MSPGEREQRLKFLGLTERDEQLLKALRPLLEKHVVAIEDAFYEHLLSFSETAQLLRDHTTVERLKKLQRDYLLRITEGNFDDAYFADRLRVGKTHERVGLSPRWYLSGYNLYFRLIAPLIQEHYGQDAKHATDALVALEKAFMLDASLAMDAYIVSDRYRHLQQLESVVRDSADAIFMLDTEKKIRTWNRAAEEIFGWRTDEILGKSFEVLVPTDVLARGELDRIDQEIAVHGHYHFDTVRVAKDGRRVQVDVTASLLRDPQGNILGRCAILRDISERKRLEEAKLQAERLAVIGTMAAKLAHEIRNPLSSIKMNIALVGYEIDRLTKDDAESAKESRSLLQSIDSEVRRIQRVTQDYLKFARIPKPRSEKVPINDVLGVRLAFMESLFQSQNVTLHLALDESLPPIRADEEQLWQAVLNLVQNALEAMPGGGSLTVTTARKDPDVVLTIADTGKGMCETERQQVFKPFFSTKQSGTGLGLPLTQQIIVEHGGQIVCESIEGKGTTFLIRLPIEPKKSQSRF